MFLGFLALSPPGGPFFALFPVAFSWAELVRGGGGRGATGGPLGTETRARLISDRKLSRLCFEFLYIPWTRGHANARSVFDGPPVREDKFVEMSNCPPIFLNSTTQIGTIPMINFTIAFNFIISLIFDFTTKYFL